MSDQGSPTWSAAEESAMRRAIELAASPGVPTGPNPRVGCVLLDDEGAKAEEMKEGRARLVELGLEPTVARWFESAKAS